MGDEPRTKSFYGETVDIASAKVPDGYRIIQILQDRNALGQGYVEIVTEKAANLMSGSEWYERFEKEFSEMDDEGIFTEYPSLVKPILETARKAAGLK